MATKRAFITGITGQDGSYLAEHLLDLGYEVHGVVRRVATEDPEHRFPRIQHISDRLILHEGSVESYPSIFHIFSRTRFDECYHLAAQSFVAESFPDGFNTLNTNINGTHFVLAAIRVTQPDCHFYFAGTSEMFGRVDSSPQDEQTPFRPRSPYGISKVTGYELTRNYREAYNMFCCSGILFNHESPRRGYEFVTRKISNGAARIAAGFDTELRLGNLEARRDWGHAADYVKAMHAMLQQEQPDDFVIATGTTHSVADFCELAFSAVDLDYRDYVVRDDRFYRPNEKHLLVGDATKAHNGLGWQPHISFEEMVRSMVMHDVERLRSGTQQRV